MLFYRDLSEPARKCSLEIHCPEIKLSQEKLEGGYLFEGYGVIKSQDNGVLYLDFICTRVNKHVDPQQPIPADPFNEKHYLSMVAKAIGGFCVTSEFLRLKPEFHNMAQVPTLFSITLSEITIKDNIVNPVAKKSVCFEFKEKCNIPKNKNNTTESTLGTKTFNWNQTVLNIGDVDLDIVIHDNRTEVRASFEDTDTEHLMDSLLFYIGFTNGSFPQPYIVQETHGENATINIRSIDSLVSGQHIAAPMSELVYSQDKKPLDHHHYRLFENILNIATQKPELFECTYSHWKRIWHSFQCHEGSVSRTALSVGIEGILNDIFIPELSKKHSDGDLENKKKKIIGLINELPEVDIEHKKNIQSYVSKWGNVHAKKVLKILQDHSVITKKERKDWSDMRNSSTHPKLIKMDMARRAKLSNRTYSCLGLFYKLILNVFYYGGPVYDFSTPSAGKFIMKEHVDVLELKALPSED